MDKKNVYNEYGYIMKFNDKLSFNCKKNDAGFSLRFMKYANKVTNRKLQENKPTLPSGDYVNIIIE